MGVSIRVSIDFLAMKFVVEVKQGLADTGLLSVIVCKLKRREKYLLVSILKYKGSYELLNILNCNFRLFIGLRVVCRRHEKFYSQDLVEGFPKVRGKLGVMIEYNIIRESMILEDISEE